MERGSWKLTGIVVMLTCVLSLVATIGPVEAQTQKKLNNTLDATDCARPAAAKTEKAKAESDGEDVLTPFVAEAVVVAATKK